MMNGTKRWIAALCAALMTASLLAGCGAEKSASASVQQVAMLMGTPVASVNRYAGVVVSQSETVIQKDETKKIDQMLVAEGDEVEEGQPLFTYNMEDLSLSIQKAQLEIEQLTSSLSTYDEQIAQLEKEKKSASATDQLSYTVQIQELQLNKKEAQYNISVKQTELANLQNSAANNQVTSPVAGHIKSLNVDGGTDQNGNALPLMTIVQSGAFRIKGTINELNRDELSQGSDVIIRSRTNDTDTWHGTIESINWDAPNQSDRSSSYAMAVDSSSTSDNTEMSSSYPFYVTIDDTAGLILGQHVYLEADYGQDNETGDVWLEDGYITLTDNGAYVWTATGRSTLEKRAVTLGEHDEELGRYTITDGLAATDYVAWPANDLKEGMKVVYYDDSAFEDESDAENDANTDGDATDDMPDDGTTDDGVTDDGTTEDGVSNDTQGGVMPIARDAEDAPAEE